ncbi:hypothetical protein CASFOL_010859 [Castilleja foliolosa]|uniref:cellulase n=1 Tax=Castilleja foliolosa TaxID=1961234 RepID=A0ABD3DXL2_9LAMI
MARIKTEQSSLRVAKVTGGEVPTPVRSGSHHHRRSLVNPSRHETQPSATPGHRFEKARRRDRCRGHGFEPHPPPISASTTNHQPPVASPLFTITTTDLPFTADLETKRRKGDGDTNHYCWQRPEDMTTSRGAYKIDPTHPGSDLA